MIPYALGFGGLSAALSQLSPWWFLALIFGLWFKPKERVAVLIAYGAVMIHLALTANPWQDKLGQWVTLEANVQNSIANGNLYLDHFPRLEDGRYRLEGRIKNPDIKRNPGGFDQSYWLRGLGISKVMDVGAATQLGGENKIRKELKRRLEAGLSNNAAGLNVALTLGERRNMGETYGEFQRAGLAHALALSGLNVSVLTIFLVFVLAPVGRTRYLIAGLVLLSYVALVGPQPSLVRAVMMGLVYLLGMYFGRGTAEVLPLLCLSFFFHMVFFPQAIFSLSLQMSYLAVLGMALVLPQIPKFEGLKAIFINVVILTGAAQLFLLPILLHNFHQLPLVSPLANLLVIPVLNILIPLGFLKLFLGSVLAWPVEILSQISIFLVGAMSKGPMLTWGVIKPVGFALYYAAMFPLIAVLYRKISLTRGAALLAATILVSFITVPSSKAELWQLDVGQGDATLVRLPGHVDILVDGGREGAYSNLEGALKAMNIRDLDVLVATHPDADHVANIPKIIQNFKIGTVVTGPRSVGDPLDDAVQTAVETYRVKKVETYLGGELNLNEAKMRFTGPTRADLSDNERSLVFILEFRKKKILFTGDAPSTEEEKWTPEKIDILKVGHHGSQHSSSDLFLERFRPTLALIGVGPNTYGHPTDGALSRLLAHGVEIHRTDLEGAIRVSLE